MGIKKGHWSKGIIWHWLCDSPLRGVPVARGVRASSAISPAGLRLGGKAPERAVQTHSRHAAMPHGLCGFAPPPCRVVGRLRASRPCPLACRPAPSLWSPPAGCCQFGSGGVSLAVIYRCKLQFTAVNYS